MTKILMYGCNGYMGHVICDLIKDMDNAEVAAGVDVTVGDQREFPVFTSLDEVNVPVDVIIDFSAAPAVDAVLDYAAEHKIPLVECTTGLSEEQLAHLKDASQKTAVLRSANMSLGINTLLKMVKTAAKVLGEAGFDIDIVEKHHRRKLDAPSGTALALADSINEASDGRYTYTFDRSQRRMQRPADEIGISAVRGGTIVGEHEIIFAGTDEVIEFKHTAYSRAVFGKGAIEAALYLAGRPAGLYDMSDVIDGAQ
ncbi:MAG TPA: 4-hydroxy-tetrahydrodipicolinate reductase [Candidatus Anaerobutyricum stercoripullorum]|uniref:4-hydroxy-tetrahydrodipicolinate reductase n=1 Tax=Candidatus Anaerobutyricum stercoripullorum TaxID=2838456 RepID=A0A9D2BDQ1_9FIRM|nr:4-hydroxy-tetrahydrodipicolinate reductase [Candidatus Anaerobutyricum stercoripullorum]